jgi:hypothetical protein
MWILYWWSAIPKRTCDLWSVCENNGNHYVQCAGQMVCFVSTTASHKHSMNCCIFEKLHSPFLCSFSFHYIWFESLELSSPCTHCKVVLPNTFWFSDIDTPYPVCLQYIVIENGYEWHLSYLSTSQLWTWCIQQTDSPFVSFLEFTNWRTCFLFRCSVPATLIYHL